MDGISFSTTVVQPLRTSLADLQKSVITQYILLAGIVLLGGILRFYKLGEWSFWIDEWYTLDRALAGLDANLIRQTPSTKLVAAAVTALGINEGTARLAPALIGIISLPVLYFPVRHIFRARIALISMLLLAISPWHIFWSQNARFYTALMLFFMLALLTFFIGYTQNRPRYIVLALLFLALALLERLLALMLVPTIFGFLLLESLYARRFPRLNRRMLLILLAAPLVFILVDILQAWYTGDVSFFMFYGTAFIRDFVGNPATHPVRVLLGCIYNIGLPLACMAAFAGLYTLVADPQRKQLYVLCGAFIPLLALLALSPFFFAKDRYVFLALPCWTILAAVAIDRLFVSVQDSGKILVIGVLCLLVLEPFSKIVQYYYYQDGYRQDWRSAFALIEERRQPDSVVATTRTELGDYYLGGGTVSAKMLEPATVVQSGQEYWFVLDPLIYSQNPDLVTFIRARSELVRVLDVHMSGKVMELRVYTYNPEQ